MDAHLLQAALGLLAFTFFCKFYFTWHMGHKVKKTSLQEAPEPSGKWPVIGHLHQLGSKLPLPRILGAIADKYGPLFTLWLGQRRVLVVSNWEVARECLTVHDKVLATRPLLAASKYMSFNNYGIGLAPYGPYWREARKLATLHLLSARQVELTKHIRASEVNLSINQLYNQWVKNRGQPVRVEFNKWLGDLTFNNIVMMVAGKRYYGEEATVGEAEAGKYKEAIEQWFYLAGMLVPSDAIPILEWLDLGGYIRAMKRTERELDLLASGWIREHRERQSGESRSHRDVIDVMLSMIESFPVPDCDPDSTIKGIALTRHNEKKVEHLRRMSAINEKKVELIFSYARQRKVCIFVVDCIGTSRYPPPSSSSGPFQETYRSPRSRSQRRPLIPAPNF